ncbi:MAG: HAMP domain-containing protein [Anaerotignum sp.]|nr:HAMP domain-containing protein [Anaerotignum sp.]
MSKKTKNSIFQGFRHLAIAKRITLLYGGIFTLSLLFLSFFMILNISSMQQSTMRKELQDSMVQIQEYLDRGETLSDEGLSVLLAENYVEASVFSYEEDVMYSSLSGNVPPFILHPETALREPQFKGGIPAPPDFREQELNDMGYEISVKRENKSGNQEYILENEADQQFMLISSNYETEGGMYRIQVFRMLSDRGYMILNFVSKLVIADVIGIFCAFLIGQYISRRVLKPVAAIREAAERISIEDLSQRISTDGPDDEMKELTETFNSMIDRLETSFQKQNQFISDASHELRTPISVIQGYANLINRWGKSDPAVLQESIDSILTETEHMSALIRQLLFLAKGDQSKLNLHKERMSLNEVAAELVREMEVLDVDRKITFKEEGKVEIFADYDMIKQLLWVHGENALKYTNDGGEVEVNVWKDKKFAYVSVKDNGTGIAEEDIPKIFDRFYRVDKSRNKEISGTGLGLSIAKWIMDSHDGEILVESVVDEGTSFINRFRLYVPDGKMDMKIIQK